MAGRKQPGGNINPYLSAEQWPPPCDVLIVGGGGGGAFNQGCDNDFSGGAGGQVVFRRNFIPPLGASSVVTGTAGLGPGYAGSLTENATLNTPGRPSTIWGIVALGGLINGGAKNATQGYNGYYIPEFDILGTDASNNPAPATATGGYGWFGGGGAGGYQPGNSTPGASIPGGAGGGGACSPSGADGGSPGIAGTGGGGGAGNPGNNGTIGGSGIIAIRYPANYANATSILGTFTARTVNGYKYYIFDYGSADSGYSYRSLGNTIVF